MGYTSAEDRFQRRVEITGFCWLWRAATDTSGYCQTFVDGHRVMAHRWVYEWLIGPITEGYTLDHLCRVRTCVNPDHLDPVPCQVNVQRGLLSYALRVVCSNGHDITNPENVRVRANGTHRCRICAVESQRRSRYGPSGLPPGGGTRGPDRRVGQPRPVQGVAS